MSGKPAITPDMLPEAAIDDAKEVRSYHCTTDEIICAFLNAAIESGEAVIEHEHTSPGMGYSMPTGRSRIIIKLRGKS